MWYIAKFSLMLIITYILLVALFVFYLFIYSSVIIFNAGEDERTYYGHDIGYIRNNTVVFAWLRYLIEQNGWK